MKNAFNPTSLLGTCLSLVALAGSEVAYGDFTADFEPPVYSGAPSGVGLAGQDGWYIPVGGSLDYRVYTYADNALGFVQNPGGGSQFASMFTETFTSVRGQHDVNFAERDVWVISYDMAANVREIEPGAEPIGSFSLQDSATSRSFIASLRWIDRLNPLGGARARFDVFNAFGGAFVDQSPGPAWENLQYNHWYRQSITVDFTSNQVIGVSLTDLHTGETADAFPTDWYLRGGESPSGPLPSAVRLFSSGNTPINNRLAWDNVSIVPEPATAFATLLGALALVYRRRERTACS